MVLNRSASVWEAEGRVGSLDEILMEIETHQPSNFGSHQVISLLPLQIAKQLKMFCLGDIFAAFFS